MELDKLSRLLYLHFKKLIDDANYKRVLEAFWRATRDEFNTQLESSKLKED